jgi:dihydrofolate reductase
VRNVILYVAASLDGYIAEPDGGVAYLEPFEGSSGDGGYAEFIASVEALVMGATTYRQVLGFGWPYGARAAFVFTHRELPVPESADIRFVSGPVEHVLPQLEGNVFLVGGAELVRQFLEAGAIDELHLHVVPVLLGDGIPLFADPPLTHARLIDTQLYASGILRLRYRLNGFDGREPV